MRTAERAVISFAPGDTLWLFGDLEEEMGGVLSSVCKAFAELAERRRDDILVLVGGGGVARFTLDSCGKNAGKGFCSKAGDMDAVSGFGPNGFCRMLLLRCGCDAWGAYGLGGLAPDGVPLLTTLFGLKGGISGRCIGPGRILGDGFAA